MLKLLPVAVVAVPLALLAGFLPGQDVRAAPNGLLQFVQAENTGFSDGQLEAYVSAVVKIQEIDKAWQPRIEDAQTSGEAADLTRRATERMIAEVEAQGLTVQEYNSITQAAERDDQLYERILTLLAESR